MAGVLCGAKENATTTTLLSLIPRSCSKQRRSRLCPRMKLSTRVSFFSGVLANSARSSKEKVYEVVLKQAALVKEQRKQKALNLSTTVENDGISSGDLLNEALW
ncbi:hypothetical protein SLA2020_013770 [Shorea laevis]